MSTALEAREVVARVDELDPVSRWRFDSFLEIGFTVPQAEKLATTRGDDGFYLYPGDVKELLDRGCPPETAFDLVMP